MSTPELSVAIKAAQRMCGRGGGLARAPSVPRSLSRSASEQGLASSNGLAGSGSVSSVSSASLPMPNTASLLAAPATTSMLVAPGGGAAVPVSLPLPATAALPAASMPPVSLPILGTVGAGIAPVSVLPRVASADRALSALRQATAAAAAGTGAMMGMSTSPSLPISAAMSQQLLASHLAVPGGISPLTNGAAVPVSAALLNGAVAYPVHPL